MKLLMSKINDTHILLIVGFNVILTRILMQKAFLNITMSFPNDRITSEKMQLQFLVILNFAHVFFLCILNSSSTVVQYKMSPVFKVSILSFHKFFFF